MSTFGARIDQHHRDVAALGGAPAVHAARGEAAAAVGTILPLGRIDGGKVAREVGGQVPGGRGGRGGRRGSGLGGALRRRSAPAAAARAAAPPAPVAAGESLAVGHRLAEGGAVACEGLPAAGDVGRQAAGLRRGGQRESPLPPSAAGRQLRHELPTDSPRPLPALPLGLAPRRALEVPSHRRGIAACLGRGADVAVGCRSAGGGLG